MSTARRHGYGWRPSLPDQRNWQLRFPPFQRDAVQASVDLRSSGLLPDVWDQGPLGSCVSHGIGAAYSYDLAKQGGARNYDPSRLFIYYNGRVSEGTVGQDSGLTITDGAKALAASGAPPSADWPYDITRYTVKPPAQAYTDGQATRAVKYAQVQQSVADMQACLSAEYPIVIGFTVYESFESDQVASTGVVPMPSTSEQVLGGHCALVVGYGVNVDGQPVNDGRWLARNSWGTSWGKRGYFTFPQPYLINSQLASDFWVVQQVNSPDPTPTPPQPGPPPADALDAALIAGVDPWAMSRAVWSRLTKAGRARSAYLTWKHGKGY
jgi:C1A family cysteine protease